MTENELQGLIGRIPNLGSLVSSKITSISLQDTSLMQCNGTQLSALHGVATAGTVNRCHEI